MWLFGLDDFEKFNLARVYPEKGLKPPPHGPCSWNGTGCWFPILKPVSIARVRVGGKLLQVPVAGIIFDPGQAPSTQDAFIYAYADKSTYTEITGEPANQRLIFRLKNAETNQGIQAATDVIVADMRSHGITSTASTSPSRISILTSSS